MRDGAYKDIARSLGWSGDYESVSQCINKITNQEDKKRTHGLLAHDCHESGNMGCYESNMQQVRLLSVNDKYSYYSLIGEYLKYNDVKGAKSYAESIVNKQERNLAYYTIAIHLAENGDLPAAEEILMGEIPEYSRDSALEKIAVATAKNNVVKGLEIVGRISQAKEKNAALSGIGVIQAENGDFTGAWNIATQLENQEQKTAVIAAIANKQAKEGNFALAESTIDKASIRDAKTAVEFSIAEAQISAGALDAALSRIKVIESLIEKSPSPAYKSKFGTFDDTAKLARVRSLHAKIAGQLAKRGDMDGYRKQIKIAQEALTFIKPDAAFMTVFIVIDIIRVQLDAGDVSGAKATITMPGINENSREMVVTDIISKQLSLGDISGAITTVKTVKRGAYAYGAISAKLVESGKMTEALELLAAVDYKNDETDASFLFSQAAGLLGKLHRDADLIKWVAMMPTPEAKVYAFLGAAGGIAAAEKSPKVP